MSEKIKEMDQNSWVCYKFNDGSYYYGEAGYLDEAGVVHPHDNAEMASNPKAKLVKHGFGIYIYQQQNQTCRYQGYWEKDLKNGEGILRMKNGSFYEGKYKEGHYHGMGKLMWENGDVYEGSWRRGRMDGPGAFKRNDGTLLKGSYKNNYFIDGNILRNPLMPDHEYEEMKKRRKQISKQYEKNEKAKLGYLERLPAKNTSDIISLVKKSVENNRVPLVLTSQQSKVNLPALIEKLKQNSLEVKEIDLRKGYSLQGEDRFNFKKDVSKTVQQALSNGHLLVLNLDESESQFEQMFYPEIKEFYEPNGFNHTLWSPKDLRKQEIHKKIVQSVHEDFKILVWSKQKYPQQINSDSLYEKVKKRYECVIPFIKIDIVFGEKEPEEEKPEEIQ